MPQQKKRKPNNAIQSQIRIIAGQWRSRRLNVPSLPGLRPTGDRTRETLFNWLSPYIIEADCLDLYAGTGSLGLEALSRGANSATFIDTQKTACDQLYQNLTTLKCETAEVINTSAENWMQKATNLKFDIVFFDPPFAENLWDKDLEQLSNSMLLNTDSLIYIEKPKERTIQIPSPWKTLKQKDTGNISAILCSAT